MHLCVCVHAPGTCKDASFEHFFLVMLWSVAKYRNLRIYEDYIEGLSIFYKGGTNTVMVTEICPVLVILDEMRTQKEVEVFKITNGSRLLVSPEPTLCPV